MNNGYKRWIEDTLDIVDKTGTLVPMKLNKIQDKFLTEDSTNSKDIILKARQQGFSSLILAMFTADFILKENVYNVVVADNSDNAMGLLKRVKDYLKCWGDKRGVDVDKVLKYNSKYELYFAERNNTYKIGTAQNLNFGRSRTITNLHLSEVAFYPNIPDIIAGAGQATVENGRMILETTANGFNDFKKLWDESYLHEGGYATHFYPASDFYPKEFLERKRNEFLALGKERLYRQEYPDTALEAFITSGDLYFRQEALEQYLGKTKEPERTYLYV